MNIGIQTIRFQVERKECRGATDKVKWRAEVLE